jgi:hypothetical protein
MPQADAAAVRDFLAHAHRRVTLVLAIQGAATGFLVAVMINMVIWLRQGAFVPPGPRSLALVALGIVVGIIRSQMRQATIATTVESRAPECRNLLVTANELIARPATRTEPYVVELVLHDATRLANSLEINALFPARGALTALVIVMTLWIVAATRHPVFLSAATAHAPSTATTAAISSVDVEVTNPAYIGGTARTLHDPARIEVAVGSRVRLTVRADGDSVAMETLGGRRALTAATGRSFTGEFLADADGYLALEPVAANGRAGARRLIGISVIPDLPPAVRITAPGRDQHFTDGKHTIDIAIEASDDNALASLRLRYTRVSGSGERFTFTEGEVPLTIVRADARSWKAHASWHLDSLALEPGDMVVYRAVASDNRPGAPATESDSYIAEVLAPGGIAAAGFAVDPEVERYALSEEMVILKSEKLLARKGSMVPGDYSDEAAGLAAEQRSVRAVFVFMMGGEVGGADDATGDLNEEAETSGEGDLALQRMLNQGRAALLSAIRSMSRASTALTTPDVTIALTHERVALAEIEKTFAHSRIILRALTERERIDLTRRLTGTLTDAATDAEPLVEPERDPRVAALRKTLSEIASLPGATEGNAANASRASALAESVLRVDPSSKPGQQVAAQLDSAASAMNGSQDAIVRLLLDHAATGVARIVRARLLDAPFPATDGDAGRLAGALTDALRRRP